jgi:hypothetical protein
LAVAVLAVLQLTTQERQVVIRHLAPLLQMVVAVAVVDNYQTQMD